MISIPDPAISSGFSSNGGGGSIATFFIGVAAYAIAGLYSSNGIEGRDPSGDAFGRTSAACSYSGLAFSGLFCCSPS